MASLLLAIKRLALLISNGSATIVRTYLFHLHVVVALPHHLLLHRAFLRGNLVGGVNGWGALFIRGLLDAGDPVPLSGSSHTLLLGLILGLILP